MSADKDMRKCEGGELFDMNKAVELGSTWSNDCAGRWRVLYRTAKGAYVLRHATAWQGEHSTYRVISKREAQELAAEFCESNDGDVIELMKDAEEI